MKKVMMFFGAVLIVGVFFAVVNLMFNTGTWECVKGEWVKKGNPLGAPPTGGCGSQIGVSYPTVTSQGNGNFNTDGQKSAPQAERIKLEVEEGKEFPIILEDSSGGFDWKADYDSSFLDQISKTNVTEETETGVINQEVFVFKGKKKGTTLLNLIYQDAYGVSSSLQGAQIYNLTIE